MKKVMNSQNKVAICKVEIVTRACARLNIESSALDRCSLGQTSATVTNSSAKCRAFPPETFRFTPPTRNSRQPLRFRAI